ncbi:hypothetical protein [Microbacterium sp. A93]|uniref:hypothetical protein n=1 Tax=Microbacterium sp. A93 TaxID=3450716 RepID=UPI003F4264EE
MSTSEASSTTVLPAGTFRRWTASCGWFLAVAVPLWLVGGRVLTDSAGSLTPVYAATLAPVLLVLWLVALTVPARRPARLPSLRACTILLISWGCGIILGFTLPDAGEGASSVLGALAGPGAEGAAAALSNPLGIITLFTAVMGCVIAVRHSAHGDGSGRPRDTDEDEAQGTGYFPVLDV